VFRLHGSRLRRRRGGRGGGVTTPRRLVWKYLHLSRVDEVSPAAVSFRCRTSHETIDPHWRSLPPDPQHYIIVDCGPRRHRRTVVSSAIGAKCERRPRRHPSIARLLFVTATTACFCCRPYLSWAFPTAYCSVVCRLMSPAAPFVRMYEGVRAVNAHRRTA
jgi:hypothetical protein